jgi:hypothetical protein
MGDVQIDTLREIVGTISIHFARVGEEIVVVTEGLSEAEMSPPLGQEQFRFGELLVRLPEEWPLAKLVHEERAQWPIDWMRSLAAMVQGGGLWLGGSEPIIVANGDPPAPLGPDTAMTCWFVFIDGSDESAELRDDGKRVHYYTMLPIYTEERDLERRKGTVALVRRWERKGVDMVVRPHRRNTA